MKFFLILGLLYAPVVFSVTEEDIIKSVVNHFPLIEQSRLKYEASKGEIEAAKGAFDHKLSFKARNRIEDKYDNQFIETTLERQTGLYGLGLIAGHRQGSGTFPPYDGYLDTSGGGEVFAGIFLPLLRNFQTDEARTNLLINKLQKDIAQAEVELKKNIYIHKALILYYKWLFANQKLKIRLEVLKIAEDRQSILSKKFKAGDIDELKLEDNLRSIDKRKDELAKARIDWQMAMTELALYYRDSEGKQLKLSTDTFPVNDLKIPDTKPLQWTSIPQLMMIDQALKIRDAENKLYSQSKLPGLNLELVGAKELSPNEPYDPESLKVGIKFDFPLENRKAEGKTVASEYKLRALRKERQFVIERLKQQYDLALESTKLSKVRWETITSEFERTKKLANAERSRWVQGASDLYIVNLREQDLAEADIKRWLTWFEFHVNFLDARLYSASLM